MASPGKRIGYRHNLALANRLWPGQINREQRHSLRSLSENYGLSVAAGDLQLLENRWYVTHSGLIGLATRSRCHGIQVQQVRDFCDPLAGRWVFKASVYKSAGSKGFVGYGDADPSNVSSMVHGAELCIAETRAVNRALRKAYGIGLCSVEELGAFSSAELTLFGRCFEKALESYFCGDDCSAALHREWGAYRDTPFAYKRGELGSLAPPGCASPRTLCPGQSDSHSSATRKSATQSRPGPVQRQSICRLPRRYR